MSASEEHADGQVGEQADAQADAQSDEQADQQPNERLARMESKLTYLEHTVEVLAGELEAQQTETRRLRRALDRMQEQLESLGRDPGGAQDNEPPPHY